MVSRARDSGLEVKANCCGVAPLDGEKVAQQLAASRRLPAAQGIERDVAPPLQPALGIPVGFAVPDEIELARGRVRGRDADSVPADDDVRCIGVLHADDVVAGIDVVDLAGHARATGPRADRPRCRRPRPR